MHLDCAEALTSDLGQYTSAFADRCGTVGVPGPTVVQLKRGRVSQATNATERRDVRGEPHPSQKRR